MLGLIQSAPVIMQGSASDVALELLLAVLGISLLIYALTRSLNWVWWAAMFSVSGHLIDLLSDSQRQDSSQITLYWLQLVLDVAVIVLFLMPKARAWYYVRPVGSDTS